MQFQVKKNEEGLSLLEFIEKVISTKYSRKEIKRRIENNACRVNGIVIRIASKQVTCNDAVEWEDRPALPPILFDPKRILHEDDSLVFYNKPPGVACDQEGIVNLLAPMGRLFLVHRLDKYTSGVLLLAKTREAETAMLEAFRTRAVEKCYIALCDGEISQKSGSIENFLGVIGELAGQTIYGKVPEKLGKHARTDWEVKKQLQKGSLIACYPETGRTHQIRVHMSEFGHPVLGDFQYGKRFLCQVKPPRMLLHAYSLKVNDLIVKAPIPKDFQDMVKLLS